MLARPRAVRIIHRAHEISETELDSGIRHARRFIEQLGYERCWSSIFSSDAILDALKSDRAAGRSRLPASPPDRTNDDRRRQARGVAAAGYHALLTEEWRHREGQSRQNRRHGWHEPFARRAREMARALLAIRRFQSIRQ